MVDVNSEQFNNLIRCQQACNKLLENKETLEMSKEEIETIQMMLVSITEDIELITGEQQVIL